MINNLKSKYNSAFFKIIRKLYGNSSLQDIIKFKKNFLNLKNLHSIIMSKNVMEYMKNEYNIDKHFLNKDTVEGVRKLLY
jgi:hypothetical protein